MFNFLLFVLSLSLLVNVTTSIPQCQEKPIHKTESCNQKVIDKNEGKIVCVCNKELGCDQLSFDWPQKSGEWFLVTSSQAGKRFNVSDLNSGKYQLPTNSNELESSSVRVRMTMVKQPILGWGGSFTDATGVNLESLSPDMAHQVLESYFGAKGLQYNFGRVPIAGSDFSTRPYTYDDVSNGTDFDLIHWLLQPEDYNFKIPYIRKATELVKNSTNLELKLIASPWSPPRWMKTNNNLTRGELKDEDRVYKSYADYLIKFYEAYKLQNITFWGATIQNEPLSASLPFYPFNSLQVSNKQMIKFISKFLGPALVAKGYTKDNFKLIIGDDSLGLINTQVPQVLQDEEVRKYVSGMAFHWYTSGILVPYDSLNQVVDAVKDKIEFVLMTEACTGFMPLVKKVDLGSWDRGQSYAKDVILDLERQTGGWIDWNLALDPQGGPNWAKNFVDSPIIVNASSNEFYKQPMYYALGHFSRFFRPNSLVLVTEVTRKQSSSFEDLYSVAVHNRETGHVVLNILNTSKEQKKVEVSIDAADEKSSQTKVFVVDGKSVNSLIVKV